MYTPQPLQSKLAAMIARRALQPLWRNMFRVSLRGLGYHNYDPERNGEVRFWRHWAAVLRGNNSRSLCVFDVGANEGDFTAAMIRLLPPGTHFFLFEPNPKTAARLKRRFEGWANVVVERMGAGACAGTLPLYDIAGEQGSPLASFLRPAVGDLLGVDVEAIAAPVVPLDDYCRQKGVGQIDFLKIDTEGYERMVLEGARSLLAARRIGTIQIEMNEHNVFTGFSTYDLHRRLPGFHISRMMPYGLEPLVRDGLPYSPRYDIARYCNLVCHDPNFAAAVRDGAERAGAA